MSRPNVVFILIDDMGWKDIGCYGSSFYETPNLDRLRAEGMLFTDAYAACPVCSPTRASILTGRYPARVGVTNYISGHARGKLIDAPYIDHLPLEEHTLASAMRDGGYRTYHVGKWHLGGEPYWPEKQGFDVNVAGCDWGMPHKGYFSPYGIPMLEEGPEGEYLTDRLTDEAIALLRANGDAPVLPEPALLRGPHPHPGAGGGDRATSRRRPAAWGWTRWRRSTSTVRSPASTSGTCASRAGWCSRTPSTPPWSSGSTGTSAGCWPRWTSWARREDTLVIFTSDNGGLATAEGSPTCNAPLAEGKGWMYEGGTRECLLVRWPGRVEPGSTCATPVTSPDFYPTLLEAAGLSTDPRAALRRRQPDAPAGGGSDLDREAIFWHYPHYGNQGGTPGCSRARGRLEADRVLRGRPARTLQPARGPGRDSTDLAGAEPERTRQHARHAQGMARGDRGHRAPSRTPTTTPPTGIWILPSRARPSTRRTRRNGEKGRALVTTTQRTPRRPNACFALCSLWRSS